MPPQPGEIYWAFLESAARRPVVIVSRTELNRGRYVVAVPFTSQRLGERCQLPNCVAFRSGEFGLPKNCLAQADAIAQVATDELDLATGPVGVLDLETQRELLKAIGYVLGASFEPE